MSYDPNNLWSEVEDNAVRQFYPRHGSKWAGWSEVLPNRTTKAISARAARLGVRKNPKVDERHIEFDYTKEPDPNERYVLACMREGLTPTEIDKKRHWWSGTTIRILTERWARERWETMTSEQRGKSDGRSNRRLLGRCDSCGRG